jgi:hypothetical protein
MENTEGFFMRFFQHGRPFYTAVLVFHCRAVFAPERVIYLSQPAVFQPAGAG